MFRRDVLDSTGAEAAASFVLAGMLVSAICAAYRSARAQGVRSRLNVLT
jgi:hypothetical protein